MRTLRLALVATLLVTAACGPMPSEPVTLDQPVVGGDSPPPPRAPCDSTGGAPCHGTLPWY